MRMCLGFLEFNFSIKIFFLGGGERFFFFSIIVFFFKINYHLNLSLLLSLNLFENVLFPFL